MRLVERHIINLTHHLYRECDRLCFASKNIYNRSIYLINEDLDKNSYNVLNNLYSIMKPEECYSYLPTKVAGNLLRTISTIYKSFFKSCKSKNVDHKVGKPHFLHKTKGRYLVEFNNQAISKKIFNKSHKIKLSQCEIEFPTKINNWNSVKCVRIVPKLDRYCIEVIYSVEDVEKQKSNRRYLSIDLGINNLAAITSNIEGYKPKLINGKPLKSINQYYNKKLSYYKSKLFSNQYTSHRINKLTNKRNDKIDNYIHKASNEIVKEAIANNVTKIIIGHNDGWKDECNMKKENNQNFVNIPHSRFISKIKYKCERNGIEVEEINEAYTSKCSFLDNESIKFHDSYKGKRVKRGLYKTSTGMKLNADINGSYNILRNAVSNVFYRNITEYGIEGVVVHPEFIVISN